MVKVNGKDMDVAGISISGLLEQESYNFTRVAVALGDEIVPKEKYDETLIKDGDIVEVVSFVGGG